INNVPTNMIFISTLNNILAMCGAISPINDIEPATLTLILDNSAAKTIKIIFSRVTFIPSVSSMSSSSDIIDISRTLNNVMTIIIMIYGIVTITNSHESPQMFPAKNRFNMSICVSSNIDVNTYTNPVTPNAVAIPIKINVLLENLPPTNDSANTSKTVSNPPTKLMRGKV